MLRRILILTGLFLMAASWLLPAYGVDDQNCEDFDSQAAAQQHLRNDPTDPDALDPDNDGIACSVTAYSNTARDTTPVSSNGQAAVTTTTRAGSAAATTSTTAIVLPTTVAQTGVFSAPLFGAGLILVGIGLSLRGKRAEGQHFTS